MRTQRGMNDNGSAKKKTKISNSNYEEYTQSDLRLLLKAMNKIVGGKNSEQIKRLMSRDKGRLHPQPRMIRYGTCDTGHFRRTVFTREHAGTNHTAILSIYSLL